jgi:hypothetical protein
MAEKQSEYQPVDGLETPVDQISGSPRRESGIFEIRVRGHLDRQWSNWLDGLEIRLLDCGETTLTGFVPDQAALMGILNKLSRLNLVLISVNAVEAMEIEKKEEEK